MHNIYHDIPDLQEIADDTHVDHRGRKQYKEQIVIIYYYVFSKLLKMPKRLLNRLRKRNDFFI